MSEPPEPPTLDDVREAAEAIGGELSLPTPLVDSPSLSELLDAHVSLKLEFATPVGVFKVRGGVNLLARLDADERRRGVVAVSTGNHAQSIAYAARLNEVRAVLFVPEGANPDKIASIERLGGEVRQQGARFDDARIAAEEFAAEHAMRFIDSANEPRLIAGVATAALEVLERQQPETELVLVPVGGGSGLCGWLTVRDGLGHAAELWGVQSAQAPAAYESWRARALLERDDETMAEGLATGSAFALTQRIMWRSLDDFLLVDDERIGDAVVALLESQHLLVEPAGAATLAAAIEARERLRGRRVVLVLSGANITRAQLGELLDRR